MQIQNQFDFKRTLVLYDPSTETFTFESKWRSDISILNAIIKFTRYLFRPNSRLQNIVNGLEQKALSIPENQKADFLCFIGLFQQAVTQHNNTLGFCKNRIDLSQLENRVTPIYSDLLEEEDDEKMNAETLGIAGFLKGENLTPSADNFNALVNFGRAHDFTSLLEVCDKFFTHDSLLARFNALNLENQIDLVNCIYASNLPKTRVFLEIILNNKTHASNEGLSFENYRLFIHLTPITGLQSLLVICCHPNCIPFYPFLTEEEPHKLAQLFILNNQNYPVTREEDARLVLPFASSNNVGNLFDQCQIFYSEHLARLIERCPDTVTLDQLASLLCDNGLKDLFINRLHNSNGSIAGIRINNAEDLRAAIRVAHKGEHDQLKCQCVQATQFYAAIVGTPEALILADFDLAFPTLFTQEDFTGITSFHRAHPIPNSLEGIDTELANNLQYRVHNFEELNELIEFIRNIYSCKLEKTITILESSCTIFRDFGIRGVVFSQDQLPRLLSLADLFPDRPSIRNLLLTQFHKAYLAHCSRINYKILSEASNDMTKFWRESQLQALKASTEVHRTVFNLAKQYSFHELAKVVYKQVLKETMAFSVPDREYNNRIQLDVEEPAAQLELKQKREFLHANINYITTQLRSDQDLQLIALAYDRTKFSDQEGDFLFRHFLSVFFINRVFTWNPYFPRTGEGESLSGNIYGSLQEIVQYYKLAHRFATTSSHAQLLEYTYERVLVIDRALEAAQKETTATSKPMSELRYDLYPMFMKAIFGMGSYGNLIGSKVAAFEKSHFHIDLDKTAYNKEATSDCVLILQSGKKLHVQRHVLETNSSILGHSYLGSQADRKEEAASCVEGSLDAEITSLPNVKNVKKVEIYIPDSEEDAFVAMIEFFYSNKIDLSRKQVAIDILHMIDKYDAKIKLPIYIAWRQRLEVLDLQDLDETAKCIDWAIHHELNTMVETLIQRPARRTFSSKQALTKKEESFFMEYKYGHLLLEYEEFLEPQKIAFFCKCAENLSKLHLRSRTTHNDNMVDVTEGPRLDAALVKEIVKLKKLTHMTLDRDESYVDFASVLDLKACQQLTSFHVYNFKIIGEPVTHEYRARLNAAFPKCYCDFDIARRGDVFIGSSLRMYPGKTI